MKIIKNLRAWLNPFKGIIVEGNTGTGMSLDKDHFDNLPEEVKMQCFYEYDLTQNDIKILEKQSH